jgi:peptidoglycan/LPS O-acetylase OafA/YrhL
LYEAAVILVALPFVLLLGAGDETGRLRKICVFLGEMSYPIYIVNNIVIYILNAWAKDRFFLDSDRDHLHPRAGVESYFFDSMAQPCAAFIGTLLISWTALRFFDEPVRNWLRRVCDKSPARGSKIMSWLRKDLPSYGRVNV